jgi:hypothetical protein
MNEEEIKRDLDESEDDEESTTQTEKSKLSEEDVGKIVIAAQIGVCAAYVAFMFLSEAKAFHKDTRKVHDARTKEKIRFDRLRYKKKRRALRSAMKNSARLKRLIDKQVSKIAGK